MSTRSRRPSQQTVATRKPPIQGNSVRFEKRSNSVLSDRFGAFTHTEAQAGRATIRWCGCIAGHADRRWGWDSHEDTIQGRAKNSLGLATTLAQRLMQPGHDEIGTRTLASIRPEEASAALVQIAERNERPWRAVLDPQLEPAMRTALEIIDRTGMLTDRDTETLEGNAAPAQ